MKDEDGRVKVFGALIVPINGETSTYTLRLRSAKCTAQRYTLRMPIRLFVLTPPSFPICLPFAPRWLLQPVVLMRVDRDGCRAEVGGSVEGGGECRLTLKGRQVSKWRSSHSNQHHKAA